MFQGTLLIRFLGRATRHDRVLGSRGLASFFHALAHVGRRTLNFHVRTFVGSAREEEGSMGKGRVEGDLKEATRRVDVVLCLLLLLGVAIGRCVGLAGRVGRILASQIRVGLFANCTNADSGRAFRGGARRFFLRIILCSALPPRGVSGAIGANQLKEQGLRARSAKEAIGRRSIAERLTIVPMGAVGIAVRWGDRMFATRSPCLRVVREDGQGRFLFFRVRRRVVRFRVRHSVPRPCGFVGAPIALRGKIFVRAKDRYCVSVRFDAWIVFRGCF